MMDFIGTASACLGASIVAGFGFTLGSLILLKLIGWEIKK